MLVPTFVFNGAPQEEPPTKFAFLDCHPPVADGIIARSPSFVVELWPEGPGIVSPDELLARGYKGVVISCPHAAAHYFARGFAIGKFHYLSTQEGDASITFRFEAPLHVTYEPEALPSSGDGGKEPADIIQFPKAVDESPQA